MGVVESGLARYVPVVLLFDVNSTVDAIVDAAAVCVTLMSRR